MTPRSWLFVPGDAPQKIEKAARSGADALILEFRNQYPAYAADIMGETRSAILALQSDDLYRQRYNDFVAAMVYGDQTDFRLAIGTVLQFAEIVFENTASNLGKS